MEESQNIEHKESWRDEYLRWICGFANAQGGTLYIGVNDNKEVVGVANSHRLLEAIYNAIVHKDYTGVAIQMKVWNDRIELWNDGNLPDNFTINTLLSDHTSKPRNRNIAHIFYMAGFIESWGRGIDKIRKGLNEANLPEPIFKEHCGGLLVTIKRSSLASELFNGITPFDTKDDTKDDTKALTSRQYSIIQLIRENHTMVARKMASALNVSIPTIKRDLSFLTKTKIIIHVGSPKDGHWEILRDIEWPQK